MWQLDHIFVITSPDAPEANALESAGFALGGRAEHRGQGTANRWFPFVNGYLELLYPTDEALLRSEPVRATALWERSRWRDTGASPFGICLRGLGDPPIPTWPYRAPFLPEGKSIPIAIDAAGPPAPILFFNVGTASGRPLRADGPRIAAVRIRCPVLPAWLAAMRPHAPFLEISTSPRHAMDIDLTSAASGRTLSLGGTVPVMIRWVHP